MLEGAVQAAVLALCALAADLVVFALDVVVAEGAGAHVHWIPAWRAVLHAHTQPVPAHTAAQALLAADDYPHHNFDDGT